MRPARRQVEHVARCRGPIGVGFDLEGFQNTQVDALHDRRVVRLLAAQLPAAMAAGLQQEHIVLVDVRADAAAGGA